MNNESTGQLTVCISEKSFGVWEKENKDSQEAKTNKKTDNGKNT